MKSIVIFSTLLGSSFLVSANVIISQDTGIKNSVLLEGFNGSTNPATGMTRVTHTGTAGGTSVYSYANGQSPEGFLAFNPTSSSFDPAKFSSFRTRMYREFQTGAEAFQVFPTPVGPAGSVTMNIPSSTSLAEYTLSLAPTTANGSGIRVDPFNYSNSDGGADTYEVDYFYVDRGRTVGYEFDHDGDQLGLTYSNITGGTFLGGTVSGSAGSNDPQISLNTNFSIDPTVYQFMEIRMRASADAQRMDFFYRNDNGGFAAARNFTIANSFDNNFHTYTVDLSGEAEWTDNGNITAWRLDPTSNTIGSTFEIDYIRFYETAVVPEPGALALMLFGAAGLFAWRRRMA